MKLLLFIGAILGMIEGQAIQDYLLECPNGPGYYPHPQDCAFFYICKEYQNQALQKFVFHCPLGTLFDTRYDVCTLEQFAHCDTNLGRLRPQIPQSLTPKTSPRTTETVTEPTPAPFRCTRVGFFRNPQNCNTFIQCHQYHNGSYIEHMMNCPKGTYFREEEQPQMCVDPSPESPLPKRCPKL